MISNICVYGAGGVGGFFGGQLAHYSHSHRDFPDVHFVARGEHLARIRKQGLTLKKGDETLQCVPASATDDFGAVPACELIMIAVKGYDLQSVIETLEPALEHDTMLLPLLNGVDIYDRIRSVTQKGIVLPACVYVGTHIESPGVVRQKGEKVRSSWEKIPCMKTGICRVFSVFSPGRGYAMSGRLTPILPSGPSICLSLPMAW